MAVSLQSGCGTTRECQREFHVTDIEPLQTRYRNDKNKASSSLVFFFPQKYRGCYQPYLTLISLYFLWNDVRAIGGPKHLRTCTLSDGSLGLSGILHTCILSDGSLGLSGIRGLQLVRKGLYVANRTPVLQLAGVPSSAFYSLVLRLLKSRFVVAEV